MWLQRFTNIKSQFRDLRLLVQTLLCAVLVSGCGSMPGLQRTADNPAVQNGTESADVASRAVPARARTMYEQAVAVMAAGDFLEAQFRFHEFILQYPSFPGAHVNLAIIYASTGDDKSAEKSIADALVIDPEHAVALNQLGMLLRRQGKFHEAETAYRSAITTNPEYALAHYNLGVLNELYLQRLDIALEHFEHYQLLATEDKQVGKWIVDLRRRIGATQRTANVTE